LGINKIARVDKERYVFVTGDIQNNTGTLGYLVRSYDTNCDCVTVCEKKCEEPWDKCDRCHEKRDRCRCHHDHDKHDKCDKCHKKHDKHERCDKC